MKQSLLVCAFAFVSQLIFAQGIPKEYDELTKIADSLYHAKDYIKSAQKYSEAFKTLGWKGLIDDRYNAACSWALAGVPDSAIFQLNRIVDNANYSNYIHIINDPDLNTLHSDARWNRLIEKIKQNKEKAEANLNRPLVAILDSILIEDQKYRLEIEKIEEKYGWESKEMKNHWKLISFKDSVNLIKITAILDKYGWLGPDVVGEQGNSALFLVIQHSDQKTQEKYLPMMQEAVKNKKARGSDLALLEDRVLLGQGKKQIYGSQIGKDKKTDTFYVLPLEDPDNVDKRRAEVGLSPLSKYVEHWKIKWDPEEYKKDLPKIEEQSKRN